MTAEILIAMIILAVILLFVLSPILRASKCPCGCSCCTDTCVCGCQYVNMEMTGPYRLPEEPPAGTMIIAGVQAQPEWEPSRTSHVGTWKSLAPRVLLYAEPIYSQMGERVTVADDGPFDKKETFIERINNTRKVYLHYTNWCGYCKKMKPVWESVKTTLNETGIDFYEIDEDIAKTPGVNGYPTIFMIDENGFRHQYPGNIDFEKLRAWCVEPTPPQTVH